MPYPSREIPNDYTFMKTGTGGISTEPDMSYILVLLTIFTEDAMKLCDVYVTHENRNIVTKNDTVRALQVRAFYGTEFWSRPDIQEKIEETTIFLKDLNKKLEQEEMHEIHKQQEEQEKGQEEDQEQQEQDQEDILKKQKLESDSLSESEDESYEDLEEIIATKFGICLCEICHKMNNIHLYWSSWRPKDQSDKILKDAIDHASKV